MNKKLRATQQWQGVGGYVAGSAEQCKRIWPRSWEAVVDHTV